MGTDEGSNPSLTTLKIKETNIGGHIISRPACDDCPTCGEEMTNIMYFGEVCIKCDSVNNKDENKTMVLSVDEEKFLKRYFNELSSARGEDVIGILMLNGAFRELKDGTLVEFAKKLSLNENKTVEL